MDHSRLAFFSIVALVASGVANLHAKLAEWHATRFTFEGDTAWREFNCMLPMLSIAFYTLDP